ncbi:MAG: hypothetical protein AB7F74_00800 [Parvibaculaceae bacterium]
MSSTPGESEALDRLVASWAAKIAGSSGTTVEAIVTLAENVRDALQELDPHGRAARRLLAQHAGLSRPMLSKLETIGRRAEPLRRRAAALPPSLSSLYALARKPEAEFAQALAMDLRGKSRAEIAALFAPPSPPRPRRQLMTILVPPGLNEVARRLLTADIAAALARIMETRRVDLDISLPAVGKEPEPCREEAAEQPQSPGDDECRSRFFTGEKMEEPNPAPSRTGLTASERDNGLRRGEACATPPLPPPHRHRRADGAPAPS